MLTPTRSSATGDAGVGKSLQKTVGSLGESARLHEHPSQMETGRDVNLPRIGQCPHRLDQHIQDNRA